MNQKTAVKPAAKKTSVEPVKPIAPSKLTAQELALPYDPQKDDVVVELMANPNKIDTFQPDILGACMLGGLEISLALWLSETRTGDRTYYSIALSDAARRREALEANKQSKSSVKPKIEALHKLSLYEFRKSHPNDPDFATTQPFIEASATWWASLWVLLPEDINNVDDIRYFLVFSHRAFRPALTEKSRENAAMGVARLLQRRKELEEQSFFAAQQAKQQALTDDDELL